MATIYGVGSLKVDMDLVLTLFRRSVFRPFLIAIISISGVEDLYRRD